MKKCLSILLFWVLMTLPLTAWAQQPAPPAEEPIRQVRIHSHILEWKHDSTLDFGFTLMYNRPDNSNKRIQSAFAIFPKRSNVERGLTVDIDKVRSDLGSFTGVVKALEMLGDVETLSEPNVVLTCLADYNKRYPEAKINPNKVVDRQGQPVFPYATVSTSSKVPYEAIKPVGNVLAQVTEFRDTSVRLDVMVEAILDPNLIKLRLETSVTDLSGFVSVALNEQGDPLPVPETYTRQIKNTVLIPNEELFLAGILKTTSDHTREFGIPFLANIPLLGHFFKSHERRLRDEELLFLIQPEIMRP